MIFTKSLKTKRLLLLLLVAVLAVSWGLGGCSQKETPPPEPEPAIQGDEEDGRPETDGLYGSLGVAALKGPTGMGLSALSFSEKLYDLELFAAPDEAMTKLLSGEVQVAALSANVGPTLYNRTKGEVQIVAISTGGVLYLLQNGAEINDLADAAGKTIYASGKGSMPEQILLSVLAGEGLTEADLTINWLGSHADAAAAAMSDPGSLVLLPEPFVSATTAQNETLSIVIDLNQWWVEEYGSELPMGVYVTTREFAAAHEAQLQIFMADCQASVNFVNNNPAEAAELIAELGIIENPAVAEQAIPRCNILFTTGAEMIEALNNFYEILFALNPDSIGGALPQDDIYYVAK